MASNFKVGDVVKVAGAHGLSIASAKIMGIRDGVANGVELSEAIAGFRFWSPDDLVLCDNAIQQHMHADGACPKCGAEGYVILGDGRKYCNVCKTPRR